MDRFAGVFVVDLELLRALAAPEEDGHGRAEKNGSDERKAAPRRPTKGTRERTLVAAPFRGRDAGYCFSCFKGLAAQASVNAAIEAFGRTLALELAPQRVNVVSPGFIDTGKLLAHLPPTDRAYHYWRAKELICRRDEWVNLKTQRPLIFLRCRTPI